MRNEKIHALLSNVINRLCQFLFGKSVSAYTSGYVLTTKKVLSNFRLRGNYGEYCIDFIVRSQRQHLKITEVPFNCVSRRKGVTKTAPDALTYVNKGLGYLKMILVLLMRI
jgi:dolichol-phosphate mannosyltransferase